MYLCITNTVGTTQVKKIGLVYVWEILENDLFTKMYPYGFYQNTMHITLTLLLLTYDL